MSKYTAQIFTDRKGEFRFRIVARNGEIVMTSEGYTAKTSAYRAVRRLQANLFKDDAIQIKSV